jgi:hypothetical protein
VLTSTVSAVLVNTNAVAEITVLGFSERAKGADARRQNTGKLLAPFGDAIEQDPLLSEFLQSDESSTNDALPAFPCLGLHVVRASWL